jgi:exopolyphosphatase/guanosine-5'-triphosphate,3'-diphosphate pyrophosphatase
MGKKAIRKNSLNVADIKKLKSEVPDVMAVIDIGSTAIRMCIAEIKDNGSIKNLESLQQSVTLGKDTFTKGNIRKSSIEECVAVLKSYKKILEEYGIVHDNQVRVVATTAVREASNRDAFIDRVYIATGFDIEVIENVDVSRLTYLSLRSYFAAHQYSPGNTQLAIEVSGGSTELLLLRNNNVLKSHSYRLGALRLREMLGEFRAPVSSYQELMANDVDRTVNQILNEIGDIGQLEFIALGGDARFAAAELKPDWNHSDPVKIPVPTFSKFTRDILEMSVDELAHKYHMSFSDAETLGPALLFYTHLASALKLKSITVTDISMRNGVLSEMAMHGAWTQDFIQQIISSAIDIGKKFSFDEAHAKHVADLSISLFRALKDEHRLSPWYELLLMISALLHDIGSYVSIRSHHKHSMYLIQNSEIFGLNKKDILLISLVARYHRRSSPKPVHIEYVSLDRNDRILVVKMASILRIADALDRSGTQRIKNLVCTKEKDTFVITVPGIDDLSLEELGIKSKGSLFEEVFGMKILLRGTSPEQQFR